MTTTLEVDVASTSSVAQDRRYRARMEYSFEAPAAAEFRELSLATGWAG